MAATTDVRCAPLRVAVTPHPHLADRALPNEIALSNGTARAVRLRRVKRSNKTERLAPHCYKRHPFGANVNGIGLAPLREKSSISPRGCRGPPPRHTFCIPTSLPTETCGLRRWLPTGDSSRADHDAHVDCVHIRAPPPSALRRRGGIQ